MSVRSLSVRYSASVTSLVSDLGRAAAANDKVGTSAEKAAARAEKASQRQARAAQQAAKAASDAADKAAAAVANAATRQDAASQRAAEHAVRDAQRAANAQVRAAERARDATAAAAEARATAEAEAAAKSAEAQEKSANRKAAVAGVIAAGLGTAISKFAEFDAQMSAVAAATGVAGEGLNQLRDAAVVAGADTQYSATEAAAAITELSKAGVDATDILGGGLTGALNLAAAGQLGVADAAETMATALAQFKLGGDQASHVADLLAAGAGKAQGSVGDMGMALKQAGLVANQTGLTIEETTAGLTAFANAGLIGSDAGTSMKSMLQRLTPTSNDAAKAMDALGISAYDSQGQFIGLEQFAGNLQTALHDLTPEQRNAALATIFGSDAVRAASVLYNEGATGIAHWTKATGEQGFAAKQAATLTDNLTGDIERLGGALDTTFIQGGSGANDSMRAIVRTTEGLVQGIAGIPGPILAGAAAFGMMALVGPKMARFGTTLSGPVVAGARSARLEIASLRNAISPIGPLPAGAVRQTVTGTQRMTTAIRGVSTAMGGLKGASAGLMGAFGGPWGIALIGATAVLGKWAQGQAEAKAAADALNATVDQQTGKFTDGSQANIRDAIMGDLSPDDQKLLQGLGVDFDGLAAAALKGGPAYEDQKQKLVELMNAHQGIGNLFSDESMATEGLLRSYERQGGAIDAVRIKQDLLTDARNRQLTADSRAAGSASAAERNMADLGGAIKDVTDYSHDSVTPLGNMATGIDDVEQSAKDAKTELQGLIDNFDYLAGGRRALSAAERGISDAKDAALKAARDKGGNDADAVQGKRDATARVLEAQAGLSKARKGGKKDDIAGATKDLARAQDALVKANQRVADSYKAPLKAQQAYEAAQGALAEAGNNEIDVLTKQTKPLYMVRESYEKTRAALIEAAKARGIHGKALDAELAKYQPTEEELQNLLDDYEATPAYVATQVQTPGLPEAKKAVEGYWEVINGVPTFIETTPTTPGLPEAQAGVKGYWDVIDGVPTYHETKVEADTAGATGDVKGYWDVVDGVPTYHETKLAADTGKATSDTKGYWTVVNGVPTFHKTSFTASTDKPALGVVEAQLDHLARSRTVSINPHFTNVTGTVPGDVVGGRGGVRSAAGNIVHAYAGGGFDFTGDVANRHVPAIYSPHGAVRAFAEPETKGEGYVPLANDWRRPRAKVITQQIVSRFGGDVTWHAAGSVPAASLGGYASAPGVTAAEVRLIATEVAGQLAARMPRPVYSGKDARAAAISEQRHREWELSSG